MNRDRLTLSNYVRVWLIYLTVFILLSLIVKALFGERDVLIDSVLRAFIWATLWTLMAPRLRPRMREADANRKARREKRKAER